MKVVPPAVWLWLVFLAVPTASAFAQSSSSSGPETAPADTASPATEPPIDPAKLPVSLGRIRLQLAEKPATKTSGLKIQQTIEVVGVAPKIELWNPETAKLATGPVPWGAPTHKDFIDLVTPQEFKNYPMDLNALVQWLLQHLADKTAKSDKTENKTTE
jgi:hypothetical protein